MEVHNPVGVCIWVGLVPSEVTPELVKRIEYYYPEDNHYGWRMDCDYKGIKIDVPVEGGFRSWHYSSTTTIEVILDCDTRALYLKFHDGHQLYLKLTSWNRWRLLVKLGSIRHPYELASVPISMRVCILESIKEY